MFEVTTQVSSRQQASTAQVCPCDITRDTLGTEIWEEESSKARPQMGVTSQPHRDINIRGSQFLAEGYGSLGKFVYTWQY